MLEKKEECLRIYQMKKYKKGVVKPRLPKSSKANQIHKSKKDYSRKTKINLDLDTY